jgi:hypothetical protein
MASPAVAAGAVGASGARILPVTTTIQSGFTGVATVPNSSDAFAIGSWAKTSTSASTSTGGELIEEFTGSSWKVMTPPAVPKSDSSLYLNSIWAASVSDAWALGTLSTATGTAVQLIHWNGVSWSLQSLPATPAGAQVARISGSSASNVWIVGDVYKGGSYEPLEFHFNGQKWKLLTEGPANTQLSLVSVASATSAWAFGTAGSSNLPMFLHFNGKAWSKVAAALPADVSWSSLSAAGQAAWAVGSVNEVNGKTILWAMHWNGRTWAAVRLPVPAGKYPVLRSVVALSTTTAWAGGESTIGVDNEVFMEHLVQGKWTIQWLAAADTSPTINALAGTSRTNVWAVGTGWTGKVCQSPQRAISYHHTINWKIVATAAPVSTTEAPRC